MELEDRSKSEQTMTYFDYRILIHSISQNAAYIFWLYILLKRLTEIKETGTFLSLIAQAQACIEIKRMLHYQFLQVY